MEHPLIKRVQKVNNILFILWGGGSVLFVYFLVYMLRKAFTAATFEGYELWGMDFKIIISISQILGYLLAKFYGVKIISELKRNNRLPAIILSAAGAEFSLILFGLIPFPYNFFCLFLNGLSLGCMWGFLFAYIEGRRFTDILASLLGISIVISSGAAKSFGLFLLDLEVNPFWMPALIGGIALPLLTVIAFLLNRLPEPTSQDKHERSERVPLSGKQRIALFKKYAPLLIPLLTVNILYTVLRDIKEDFLVNIVNHTSINLTPFLFVRIDSVVAILLLLILGAMIKVNNNEKAMFILLSIMMTGSLLILLTSVFFNSLMEMPIVWLFLQSMGIYSAYLAFQTIFFDRFIANFQIFGNVGFFIYLADFLGYLASCIFLFVKSFLPFEINWLDYYNLLAISISIISVLAISISYCVMRGMNKKNEIIINKKYIEYEKSRMYYYGLGRNVD